jgi:hypothetical protein
MNTELKEYIDRRNKLSSIDIQEIERDRKSQDKAIIFLTIALIATCLTITYYI